MCKMLRWSSIQNLCTIVSYFILGVDCRVGYLSQEESKSIQESCNGTNGDVYFCPVGHCCEDDKCCTNYYELWWFWLIWGLIIIICCGGCYYKHQKQTQRRSHRAGRHRHKIYAGVCNYPGPPLDNKVMGYCKLPIYDDVVRIPPTESPPPPYRSRRNSIRMIACLQPNYRGETGVTIIPCNITSSMLSLHSLSYYMPDVLARNAIRPLQSTSGDVGESDVMVDANNNNQASESPQDSRNDEVKLENEVKKPLTDAVEAEVNPLRHTKSDEGALVTSQTSSDVGCSQEPCVGGSGCKMVKNDSSLLEEADNSAVVDGSPLRQTGKFLSRQLDEDDCSSDTLPLYSGGKWPSRRDSEYGCSLAGDSSGNVVLHLSPSQPRSENSDIIP